uniref:Leucine-rich repeat-containing N-terminal plant-type domain-containing protein n=1 Tax=Fagus sylvatica TaxID=28930 RepID=A0A2N9EUV9_FAGSY
MDSSLRLRAITLNLFLGLLITLATLDPTFCSGVSELHCIQSERQALLKIKQDLIDPSNRLASWAVDGNCCQWFGVVCSNVTGHVQELHLQSFPPPLLEYFSIQAQYEAEIQAYARSMFGGMINPSLLDLKHLTYLDLSYNNFGLIAPIPEFLGSMKSLRYLNLFGAGFLGLIPPQLGNLSNLHYLNLGVKVSDLQPVTNKVTSLSDLCLSHCNISFIPTTPSVNSSSLTTLDLSFNNFGNTLIPFWVFGHQNLVSLNLSANGFQGPIPIHLRNMTSLRHLDLSHNDFNSSIPNWLYNFSHLEFLNLRVNQLQGTISSAIGNLTSAISIDLTSNELGGKMNESKEMELLNLGKNRLSGEITDCWKNWEKLLVLNLGNNNFTGSIPTSIGSLSLLSENQFAGSIPSWIGQRHSSLIVLNLRSNNFFGHIPKELWQSLVIKGQVREYSTNLQLVRTLDLSKNYLSGEIPKEVTSLQGLQSLNFSFNILTGRIPENIGDMVSLESLDLSENQLSGHIPPSMSNLTFLSLLNLSMNHLTGKIPSSTQLQSLHESSFIGNELCGPPLTDNCTINDAKPDTGKERSKDSGGREVDWFYVSMAPGFVVGFWVVWGPVLVNRRWRIGYFQFLDRMGYKLSCVVGKTW